ncbi:hypothetical protein ABMA28_016638 [Loxostege sticticalis]|uniref:Protein lin-37 homolog n=1 Tax=Loxostege sticticalis TaxID=481309 RepID=A0ABD0T5A0_LOXSC
MPKRSRRLLTPSKHKASKQIAKKEIIEEENEDKDKEVSTARGRLKGALLDVLDPQGEESDESYEPSPTKREKYQDRKDSEDEDTKRRSPARQSYVLKLFDRSVDLSQFEENSPLYPICRAWMINQPKENYRNFGQTYEEPEQTEDSVELPGPEGPPVSRIPELLPEQKARNKDNINLNYREAPPPSREQLLRWHGVRWAAVRQAWVEQAQRVEARYDATQTLLNKININAL